MAEFSKIETDVLRKSVIDGFLMNIPIMETIPWETIGQLSTGIIRVKDLPSVGFRKINDGYAESTGHFEQKMEQIALLGGDIDTDKAYARAKNTVADARAIQQNLMLKAMSFAFNDKFINGDPKSDALEFQGLKERVDDLYAEGYTGQKLDAACSGVGILNSSTTSHAFLDKLDALMYSISGRKPDFLLMNGKTLLALRSLLRREKLLDTTKDMFDRIIDIYQGARLVDIGTKADMSTEIILNTETTAGETGGSECSSIYAVKFGVGDMLWGIQEYPLEVEDLGQLESKPVYRTRVDWPLGLANIDTKAVSRLYGITADASS